MNRSGYQELFLGGFLIQNEIGSSILKAANFRSIVIPSSHLSHWMGSHVRGLDEEESPLNECYRIR